MSAVLGSPMTAAVDALRSVLLADASLCGLLATTASVYGHVPEASRAAYPYVVLGRRSREEDGPMGASGGRLSIQIDVFSDAKGPFQAQAIQSRIVAVLERRPLDVAGYEPMVGSLTCAYEEVYDEPDEDKPGARLYHGVQRWEIVVHGR